jgi:hypothetical protein
MQLTDLIYHRKNFLSKEQCQFLIDTYAKESSRAQLEHCEEASTGIDTYSTFNRIDLKIGTEAWQLVHSATEQMINEYHDYLDSFDAFHVDFRTTLKYSHMYRLLKYDTGAKIHPHTDHGPFVYGSCTFNLNDDYTGGDFAWFRGKHKLKLGLGDALIFPADYFWVHEVLPITSGVRYSTNSFLQKIPEHIRNQVYDYTDFLMGKPNQPEDVRQELEASYRIRPKSAVKKQIL